MYKDILLPIDLNHECSWQKALPVALEYCRAFGSQLHVLTVLPDYGMALVGSYFPEGFEAKHRERLSKQLHKFVKENVPAEFKVQHIVAEGSPYKEILAAAERIGADLIVMASHRPEIADFLLGPNAERVVRHSKRSVLVVRDGCD